MKWLARGRWIVTALFAVAGATSGCSKSSAGSQPCLFDPLSCPSGQTCWPAPCACPDSGGCTLTDCAPELSCIASASGKNPGDPCENVVGVATCGDGQLCVQSAPDGGACRAYCALDGGPGCSAGEACAVFDLLGASDPGAGAVMVCLPPG